MAAARAQAKGGVSGLHIWLIVFVALWLTSTVLLVLLYTDQKDLETTNATLRKDVEDRTGKARAAENDRNAIAKTATGDGGDPPQVVQTKLADLCGRITGDKLVSDPQAFQQTSYLQALNTLYEAFKSERTKLTHALSRNEGLSKQVEELASINTNQKTTFDEQVAELTGNLGELKASWDEYTKARDEAVGAMDKKLDDLNARYNKDIQEQRTENKQVVAKFDELQNRYGELKERLGELQIKPQELITARQADGRVVIAKPGDEVAYIDLGREAHLVLGLQFAVYSAASGIPADGEGKARVEVVNIFETASECRIVEKHTREPILEGDLVANPVFDRERSLQFLVMGRFDVNGDGVADPEGERHIESLIQEWGGTVTQELSARVDFLVVGDAPPKPFLAGDATPEAQARFDAAKKVYDAYNDTVRTAQALSIPMLPRSVFMHFLGYAGSGKGNILQGVGG